MSKMRFVLTSVEDMLLGYMVPVVYKRCFLLIVVFTVDDVAYRPRGSLFFPFVQNVSPRVVDRRGGGTSHLVIKASIGKPQSRGVDCDNMGMRAAVPCEQICALTRPQGG